MSWFWLALSAAVLWGLGYLMNQITLKHFNPMELLFCESLIVFVSFSAYFLIRGDFSLFAAKLSNPKQSIMLIASSLIYVVASVLILKSIVASNAAVAAIIESCYPIFTVIFAFIFLGELQLNLASACGFILILIGIIIVKIYGH